MKRLTPSKKKASAAIASAGMNLIRLFDGIQPTPHAANPNPSGLAMTNHLTRVDGMIVGNVTQS